MTEMKTCSRCKRTKPLDEFSPLAHTRDGRASHCRECNRTLRRQSYRKNKRVENAKTAARRRAFQRLAEMYPAEFRALLAEETHHGLSLVRSS